MAVLPDLDASAMPLKESQTATPLIAEIQARSHRFAAIRRDLHRYPETAYEEVRTSAIVVDTLLSCGIEVVTGLAETGVVGILRAGSSGRAIGLRADMDALDLDEGNAFAHRSAHAGKMHACGHDGHTATLLAAAAYLAETRQFDGTVYFIFQPAEEADGGARRMIEDGLFDRFPMEAVFGLHNMPGIGVGSFAVRAGAMMAGVDEFDIRIEGIGGHAAMPHLTSDPLVATGAMIQALQTIVARNVDPMHNAVLSLTRVQGGSASNVVPREVALSGTVRYFDTEVQTLVEQRIAEVADHVARAHGCRATLRYGRLFPPTINSPAESALCTRVLVALVGKERVDTTPQPVMASEDFAFMLEAKPGCYIWLGNGVGEGGCGVHNPLYDFNDEAIPFGAAYWISLTETALPRETVEVV